MRVLSKCVARCLSYLSTLPSQVLSALSALCAVGLALLLLAAPAYAADMTLVWEDTLNDPAEWAAISSITGSAIGILPLT